MAHEETLNGTQHPVNNLREHVGGMGRDLARMAELQAQLMAADLRRARARILWASACLTLGGLLLAAMLPVALAGLGVWLADATELSLAGGLLCVSAASAAVVAGLALTAWVQFARQRQAWDRSLKELRANAQAVRQAFSREATRVDA